MSEALYQVIQVRSRVEVIRMRGDGRRIKMPCRQIVNEPKVCVE